MICIIRTRVNPLSANPTEWSNTLKQFVGKLSTNCLSVFDHFVKLALKRLNSFKTHKNYTQRNTLGHSVKRNQFIFCKEKERSCACKHVKHKVKHVYFTYATVCFYVFLVFSDKTSIRKTRNRSRQKIDIFTTFIR